MEMVFRTSTGKETTINLAEPKADLTLAQAQAVMADIVARKIFSISGAELSEVVEARIRTSETTALA